MSAFKGLIEPAADEIQMMNDSTRLALSSAISLKRIADMLENGSLFTQPVNNYGESFTDAIQMAFVRGQRGIDVI
jgi:hypothetical protein